MQIRSQYYKHVFKINLSLWQITTKPMNNYVSPIFSYFTCKFYHKWSATWPNIEEMFLRLYRVICGTTEPISKILFPIESHVFASVIYANNLKRKDLIVRLFALYRLRFEKLCHHGKDKSSPSNIRYSYYICKKVRDAWTLEIWTVS